MQLPAFKLEEYFAKYEFVAKYMLGSSDPESHFMHQILSMADKECLALWQNLNLGYTETLGLPLLREAIAKLYQSNAKEDIIVFSGAEEAIYIVMQSLLKPGDEVVVITPCYQSHQAIPQTIGGKVIEFALAWKENTWHFDLEKFAKVITDKTKLIAINFPHNPTGFQPAQQVFREIVNIAKKHNSYLFSDEVYRLSEQNPAATLPNAADCYDKAISLGVMSKSFGLAGLRIGWVATKDVKLRQKLAAYKNYTTICSSAPSEILALIALRNKEHILQRNVNIAKQNLDLLDKYFAEHQEVFAWHRPSAGFIAFPRLKISMPIAEFAQKLVDAESVLIIPGTLFADTNNHFRLGFGRRNLPEALAKFSRFVDKLNLQEI
ncbi:MAG: aminotransferase class I/II-fold pyridoxal phosphate-dependent enzyme [Gammaproteobacteria bacterium]|nr:aminotransferase class I/II-fold pyridoxal phosphate-dependent enzyme [Gammaproteobacteria bacterium]